MLVTDEMVRRALDVLANKAGGCPGLTLSDVCDDTQCGCADETRAAIEAVAPAIRAAALEEAAVKAMEAFCAIDADGYEVGLMQSEVQEYIAAAIRALKDRP